MKRIFSTFVLLFLTAFTLAGQEIRSIDENVVLRKDGSARVTQVWDVTVVSGMAGIRTGPSRKSVAAAESSANPAAWNSAGGRETAVTMSGRFPTPSRVW